MNELNRSYWFINWRDPNIKINKNSAQELKGSRLIIIVINLNLNIKNKFYSDKRVWITPLYTLDTIMLSTDRLIFTDFSGIFCFFKLSEDELSIMVLISVIFN